MKLENKSDRGLDLYKFVSAGGVESKNGFRDSELLIADYVEIEASSLLVVEANYGFLGVALGDKNQGLTTVAESSDRALQLCKINLEKNDVEASTHKVAFYSEIDGEFDKAVYAPKCYEPVDLVKQRIAEVVEYLEICGELYIAGGKTDGINRYKTFLKESQGELEKVTQTGAQRLYRYTKNDDFRPEKPDIDTSFSTEIENTKLDFKACKGLFSPHGLDNGSRLLIENIDLDEKDEVLDLACGYGAVGLFIQKIFSCKVSFSDDDALATYYTEKNIEESDLEASRIENRDCLDGLRDKRFDVIVSNPPTHQGSKITDELFRESFKHLRLNGKLVIVYNQNMQFERQLSEIFREVKVVAEKENFKVTRATK